MSLSTADEIEQSCPSSIPAILADFFLKKIEMGSYSSDSDCKHKGKKKKSKHKKEKHKKSKHRHSSKSSSCSRDPTYNRKDELGDVSSSEEKSIKRLKKIKNMKLNPTSIAVLPCVASKPVEDEAKAKGDPCSSSVENLVFYGPSLELLLSGVESHSLNSKSDPASKVRSLEHTDSVHSKDNVSEIKKNIEKTISFEDSKIEEEKMPISTHLEEEFKSHFEELNDALEYAAHSNLTCHEKVALKDNDTVTNKDSSKHEMRITNEQNNNVTTTCINKNESNPVMELMNGSKNDIVPILSSNTEIDALKESINEKENTVSCSVKKDKEAPHKNLDKQKKCHSRSRSRSKSKNNSSKSDNKRKVFRSKSRSSSRDSHSRKKQKHSLEKSQSHTLRKRSHSRSHSRSRHSNSKKSRSRSPRRRSRNHSKHKDRSLSRSRHRDRSSSRSRHRDRSSSRSRQRDRSSSRSKHKDRSSSRSRREDRSSSRSRKKVRSSSRSRQKDHSVSRYKDRSLSRSRRKDRSSSRSRHENLSSSKLDQKNKSRSRSRSKSKSRETTKSYKDSYSRSRSKEKNSNKIDQAKILETARRNVLKMMKSGTLPEGLPVENLKKEQLISIQAGGKSVQELTDFCQRLSQKENDPDDNDDKNDGADDENGFIHHPFKVKEPAMIKLNIKNAVQLPIKTHAQKIAETARLSSQFPVSSGNQHKQKELEWIPVVPEPPKTENKTSEKKASANKNNVTTVAVIENTVSSIPPPPQIPVSYPCPSEVPQVAVTSVRPLIPPPMPPQLLPPPMPPTMPVSLQELTRPTQPAMQTYAMPNNQQMIMSNVTIPAPMPMPSTSVFKPPRKIDISAIVTKRFQALTKLQQNQNDPEALATLQEAQEDIQDWVQSQQVPGLFTGSTDAKVLSVAELCGPKYYKFRKDFFTHAPPVTEGKGMSLLKKMGWNPGEGLGKNKEGSLEPLVLDIKMDKKGLVGEGENSKKGACSFTKELQGKHPVSALMELCSKRRWKPPLYTCIMDQGPSHKKQFCFKVEVNGVEYQPLNPCSNKKVAKADSAVICLQALNVFPKNPL